MNSFLFENVVIAKTISIIPTMNSNPKKTFDGMFIEKMNKSNPIRTSVVVWPAPQSAPSIDDLKVPSFRSCFIC